MTVRLSILKFFVAGLALIGSTASMGAPWGALATDSSAQGDFTQVILDETGTRLSETTGEFRVLRPNYIDWKTERPERQRYLVNDEAFWQQDEELGIVIKRDTLGAANTPLRFIWGDLPEDNDVTVIERSDTTLSLDTMIGAELQRVIAEWRGQDTLVISTTDALGQQTVVTLMIETRGALSPADFDFNLPTSFELYDETTPQSLIVDDPMR